VKICFHLRATRVSQGERQFLKTGSEQFPVVLTQFLRSAIAPATLLFSTIPRGPHERAQKSRLAFSRVSDLSSLLVMNTPTSSEAREHTCIHAAQAEENTIRNRGLPPCPALSRHSSCFPVALYLVRSSMRIPDWCPKKTGHFDVLSTRHSEAVLIYVQQHLR
jgi:hypothetical protein